MSLNTGFGETHNILNEIPSHANRLKAISPIMLKEKLEVLKSFGDKKHLSAFIAWFDAVVSL